MRFLGADTGRLRSDCSRMMLTPSGALWAHSDDGLEDGSGTLSRFLEGGYYQKPIITITISVYRHWDGDDMWEGGAELHPHDRSALRTIRDRWRSTNSNLSR